MCILVLAWRAHPHHRLILAANRDEFHERPAAALAKWPKEQILAGRDLAAGGTWLGIDRQRRFGVVTNFRELAPAVAGPSRGSLIPAYLTRDAPAQSFLEDLAATAPSYAGFNILLGDSRELWYASNRAGGFARRLEPGIYGLSNGLLDTPWPKLARVRARFESWLAGPQQDPSSELLAMLADRTRSAATDDPYPALSAPFVVGPRYGTRCSTALLIAADGALEVFERRFDPAAQPSGDSVFKLAAHAWP